MEHKGDIKGPVCKRAVRQASLNRASSKMLHTGPLKQSLRVDVFIDNL